MLFRSLHFPNYNIPTNFKGFIGVVGSSLGIHGNDDLNSSNIFSSINFDDLDKWENAEIAFGVK